MILMWGTRIFICPFLGHRQHSFASGPDDIGHTLVCQVVQLIIYRSLLLFLGWALLTLGRHQLLIFCLQLVLGFFV